MLAIIIGLMIFFIGLTLLNFIDLELTNTYSDLDCTSSDITDGTKLTCLVVDIVLPYIILIIFSAAGGGILSRLAI